MIEVVVRDRQFVSYEVYDCEIDRISSLGATQSIHASFAGALLASSSQWIARNYFGWAALTWAMGCGFLWLAYRAYRDRESLVQKIIDSHSEPEDDSQH